MPSVTNSLQQNYEKTKTENFINDMVDEIRYLKPQIVRIHVAGDFYNDEYTRKWIAICKRFPNITFFAYTRSWRVPEMQQSLVRLARLRNVRMWWSVDKDTVASKSRPPRVKGTRVAYLLTCAEARQQVSLPKYVNLVFRQRPKSVIKYYDGRLVCPAENGVTKTKIGCSSCQLCFSDRSIPTRTNLVQLSTT